MLLEVLPVHLLESSNQVILSRSDQLAGLVFRYTLVQCLSHACNIVMWMAWQDATYTCNSESFNLNTYFISITLNTKAHIQPNMLWYVTYTFTQHLDNLSASFQLEFVSYYVWYIFVSFSLNGQRACDPAKYNYSCNHINHYT